MNCKNCSCRSDDGGLSRLGLECLDCQGYFDFLDDDKVDRSEFHEERKPIRNKSMKGENNVTRINEL